MAEKQVKEAKSSQENGGGKERQTVKLPGLSAEVKTGRDPRRTPSAAAGSARQLAGSSPSAELDDNLTNMGMRSPLVDPGLPAQPFFPMPMWANPMFMGPGTLGMPQLSDWESVEAEVTSSDEDGDGLSLGAPHQPEGEDDVDMVDLSGAVNIGHDDEDGGEEVSGPVVDVTNDIWDKGRNPKTMKTLFEKYPRPSNVACHKVDLNEQVIAAIPKFARARDLRLRAVQGLIARACVPAVRIVDALYSKNASLSPQEQTNLAIESAAPWLRRQTAASTSFVESYWRAPCKNATSPCATKPPQGPTKLLFGENLAERVKEANTTSSLMGNSNRNSSRGRGHGMFGQRRYQPYAPYYGGYQQGYGYGGYHQGAQQRWGKPFLGESVQQSCYELNEKSRPYSNGTCSTNANNVMFSASRPEEPGRALMGPQGQQGEREIGDDSGPHDNQEMVGECKSKINVSKWGDKFIAGRVSQCVDSWAKITSDQQILSNIRGYKLDFNEPPHQSWSLPEIRFSDKEKHFVRNEITELLTKQVLKKAKHTQGEFVSNIFLREKREKGKYRMILNLKHLNKYVDKINFKMDTLQTTLALITPGCTFLSFDFSDAYYSCSVFSSPPPPHRKFLRFTFENQLYEFTCLPNGLSPAPRFFTKIMKVALAHLRERDHNFWLPGWQHSD